MSAKVYILPLGIDLKANFSALFVYRLISSGNTNYMLDLTNEIKNSEFLPYFIIEKIDYLILLYELGNSKKVEIFEKIISEFFKLLNINVRIEHWVIQDIEKINDINFLVNFLLTKFKELCKKVINITELNINITPGTKAMSVALTIFAIKVKSQNLVNKIYLYYVGTTERLSETGKGYSLFKTYLYEI